MFLSDFDLNSLKIFLLCLFYFRFPSLVRTCNSLFLSKKSRLQRPAFYVIDLFSDIFKFVIIVNPPHTHCHISSYLGNPPPFPPVNDMFFVDGFFKICVE